MLVVIATISTSSLRTHAEGAVCDLERDNYYSRDLSEKEYIGECIDQGRVLRGRHSTDVLNGVKYYADRPIVLEPVGSEFLSLNGLLRGCLSRLFADQLCEREKELFASKIPTLNTCPAPRVHEPTDSDLFNFVIRNLSFGLCSRYTLSYLSAPLTVRQGDAVRLELGKGTTSGKVGAVAGPLLFQKLSGRELSIGPMIVLGDVVVEDSKFGEGFEFGGSINLGKLVILGNLVIKSNKTKYLDLTQSWIKGDVIITDNEFVIVRLESLRVMGKLKLNRNRWDTADEYSGVRPFDLDLGQRLEMEGNVDLSDNQDAKVFEGLRELKLLIFPED